MGLVSGSPEYYKIKEQAERLRHKVNNSYGDDKAVAIERMNDFAGRLREKYGFDDSEVNYIIDTFYLDWSS